MANKIGIENTGFKTGDKEPGEFISLDLKEDIDNRKTTTEPVSIKSENHFEICDDKEADENPNPTEPSNFVSLSIVRARRFVAHYVTEYKKLLKILMICIPLLLFHAYLIVAIAYNIRHNLPISWCNGLGFLLILYGLGVWSFFYYFVLKFVLGHRIKKYIFVPIAKTLIPIWETRFVQPIAAFILAAAVLVFLIVDTRKNPRRLVSAGGVFVIVFIGLILSKYPGHIKWRHVIWAIGLQFVFGLMILRWEAGQTVLNCLSDKVKIFLEFTTAGTDFLYGYLSSGKPTPDLTFPPIIVFRSLCVIFFLGFIISLLYHYGAMQWIIAKLGWLLQVTIGTTAAESMSAAANIFIGQSEVPLLIKPFLDKMTNSELHAVMTGGFATIAGTVMALYITLNISASYLLSACVMAAPCALGMAKLIYPETQVSKTTTKEVKLFETRTASNAVDAAAQGAMQGVVLIGCIVANIIAFVSFVAFLNAVVAWFGNLVGVAELSFEVILGKCFVPIAYIIGIDGEEVDKVGLLLGLKTVANEFIAYERLGKMTMELSPRSIAITTYALCSFANVGSVGIQLGGLGVLLSPERRGDLAKTIGRAFIAGTLVGFLNACIAGCLIDAPGYDEWRRTLASNLTTTMMPTM